jgi:hypothetical protein
MTEEDDRSADLFLFSSSFIIHHSSFIIHHLAGIFYTISALPSTFACSGSFWYAWSTLETEEWTFNQS